MKITVRNLGGEDQDISDCYEVAFGEYPNRISVRVRANVVEVTADGQIAIQPRASNLIQVTAVGR